MQKYHEGFVRWIMDKMSIIEWSFFRAEFAGFRGYHGLKSLSDTVGSRTCLHQSLYFSCEAIFSAHLEINTTVFLYGLFHQSFLICRGQKRRLTIVFSFCGFHQFRNDVNFFLFFHCFWKIVVWQCFWRANSLKRILFQHML